MKRRAKGIIYAACMLAAAGIVAALLLMACTPVPLRLTSMHGLSTPAPLTGFSAESVFNTGTAKQLDALPGIGEVLSNRIIEGRAVWGAYRLPEDLLLVKGIGEKTLTGVLDALAEPLVELLPASELVCRK